MAAPSLPDPVDWPVVARTRWLADAGYLQDRLASQGIQALLRREDRSPDAAGPPGGFLLIVSPEQAVRAAELLRQETQTADRAVPEEEMIPASRPIGTDAVASWAAAILAGLIALNASVVFRGLAGPSSAPAGGSAAWPRTAPATGRPAGPPRPPAPPGRPPGAPADRPTGAAPAPGPGTSPASAPRTSAD